MLWAAADKLHNNMDATEYKRVVLSLILSQYMFDSFDELHSRLLAGTGECAGVDPEDLDEYGGRRISGSQDRRPAGSVRDVGAGVGYTL